MKKLVILLAVVLTLGACQNRSQSASGSDIESIALAELSLQAADLEGKDVTIKGMVTHVCKHGGQKMFIADTTKDQTVLVRVGSSIPEFDVALEGSQVEITGKIVITPAVVIAEEEHHEGEGHAADGEECEEESTVEGEDCVAETEHDKKESAEQNIKFHIEASSFKEI